MYIYFYTKYTYIMYIELCRTYIIYIYAYIYIRLWRVERLENRILQTAVKRVQSYEPFFHFFFPPREQFVFAVCLTL